MRILFCNIAWMDYYKGIVEGKDEPQNGGSYVNKTGDAHEKYNFAAVTMLHPDGTQGEYCLGFVETKSTSASKSNQLHIEKFDGCELLKNEDEVEDVLVVYCASHPAHKFTTIVGWYQHATVYRYYQKCEFKSLDSDGVYIQSYNAIAKKEDCVLLPRSHRSKKLEWEVPRVAKGASYGFGMSNIWFANGADENTYLREYLQKILNQIENYSGESWIDDGYCD